MCHSRIAKGELHIHLLGGVSPNIIFNILKKYKMEPERESELQVPPNCSSLSEYFSPWSHFRKIPCDLSELDILIESFFDNLKKENIFFVEARNTVVHIAKTLNLDIADALFLIDERIKFFSKKYAIKAGLIMTLERGPQMKDNFHALIDAYRAIGCPSTIVGIDVAGNEDVYLDDDLAITIGALAKDNGLGLTVHAGETGKLENVHQAITKFKANRIGHGIAALYSEDALKDLQKNDICLEICPISNLYTSALKKHTLVNLQKLIQCGVPFVICSDNPCIQNSTIGDDYKLVSTIFEDEFLKKDILEAQKRFSFLKGEFNE